MKNKGISYENVPLAFLSCMLVARRLHVRFHAKYKGPVNPVPGQSYTRGGTGRK